MSKAVLMQVLLFAIQEMCHKEHLCSSSIKGGHGMAWHAYNSVGGEAARVGIAQLVFAQQVLLHRVCDHRYRRTQADRI